MTPPRHPSDLLVVERLPGTSTTDFGAPDVAASAERDPLVADGLRRAMSILKACWRALDGAAGSASGVALRTDTIRAAVLDALASAARHGVEERGPRGGRRWTARYFVRRDAWHVLDHTWEIEDRARP